MSDGTKILALSTLPLANRIQEARNRFLHENLSSDEPPDIDELAEELNIPPDRLHKAVSRGNWWAYREAAREAHILHSDGMPTHEALVFEISNTPVPALMASISARILGFTQAALPLVQAALMARLTTMSDKDMLSFFKALSDNERKELEALRAAVKGTIPNEPGGTPQNGASDGDLMLSLGMRTRLLEILETPLAQVDGVIDADILDDQDSDDDDCRSALGAINEKIRTAKSSFLADLDDDEDES